MDRTHLSNHQTTKPLKKRKKNTTAASAFPANSPHSRRAQPDHTLSLRIQTPATRPNPTPVNKPHRTNRRHSPINPAASTKTAKKKNSTKLPRKEGEAQVPTQPTSHGIAATDERDCANNLAARGSAPRCLLRRRLAAADPQREEGGAESVTLPQPPPPPLFFIFFPPAI